jgi:hypothetical protein
LGFPQKQLARPVLAAQEGIQDLDRDRVRRSARIAPDRIVIEPTAVHDPHAALTDDVADDDLSPVFERERRATFDLGRQAHEGLRRAALWAEAGFFDDHALAADADRQADLR